MKENMNITYSHKFAERFLIFITMTSFFCGILSLLRDLCVANARDELISTLTIVAAAIFSLIVFAITAIFFNERTSAANFFRFVVFFTIGAGVIAYFLRSFINFPVTIIICAVMSVFYKKIFEPFYEHDCFERQCADKNTNSLKKELYDVNIHLGEAAAGYRYNRITLTIFALILTFFTGFLFTMGFNPSILSVISILVYVICLYSHLFLYSHYIREATYASDGFSNVFDLRLRIIFVSVVIFAVSFLVALAVSSNHSPLKLSYLAFLFKFIKISVSASPAAGKSNPAVDFYGNTMLDLQPMQADADETDSVFTKILGIVLAGVIIIAILWFFLNPFIKRTFSVVFKSVNLKAIFKRFFTAVGQMFKKLFHLHIKLPQIKSANAKRFGSEMSEYLKKSKKSKEKKAELDRLTKKFMLIIDWGTERGFEYTKNLAPAEYTELLNNENARKAGLYFEKALYDRECLSQEEEKEFNRLVEILCA